MSDEEPKIKIPSRLSDWSNDDVRVVDRLIASHPDIDRLIRFVDSFTLVAKILKQAAVWITVVAGGLALANDTFRAYVLSVIGGGA